MISSDFKYWPIFSLLEPKFLSEIQSVIVYGSLGNYAIILKNDEEVYSLGKTSLLATRIPELCNRGIKTFACGKSVLALTSDGKVYTWNEVVHAIGSNESGTLEITKFQPYPIVVEIACGGSHALLLTNDGKVYNWSERNITQNLQFSNYSAPGHSKQLEFLLDNAICISCANSFSIIVTKDGKVYMQNNSLQKPIKYSQLNDITIVKVACGYSHTMALSNEGVLYVWGSNDFGELGIGTTLLVSAPVKLEVREMGRVLDIAASHYNHISVAKAECNRIFMWGQCLHQSVKTPTLTPLRSFHDVFACFASPRVMHRPLVLSNSKQSNLMNSLKAAFDDATSSDLTIEVFGKPIHVHKAVLKIRSNYFQTMFQMQWAENNQSIIKHDLFSYDVYKAFLNYLYTDEISATLSSENILELIYLADAYTESQLKGRCMQLIKDNITVKNMAYIYEASIQRDITELEECCFNFALRRMTEVVLSPEFANLEAATVKRFTIRAAMVGAFKT